ncbi:MAG TPA: hypothetical protein DCL54_07175 [Alphaproteobacteria bacterium]|nr:hypothetical protein [Alphaproteobacteria bacterium]HAJ46344.1 hypothetical protein [Alphaproteobacteria bacterium]
MTSIDAQVNESEHQENDNANHPPSSPQVLLTDLQKEGLGPEVTAVNVLERHMSFPIFGAALARKYGAQRSVVLQKVPAGDAVSVDSSFALERRLSELTAMVSKLQRDNELFQSQVNDVRSSVSQPTLNALEQVLQSRVSVLTESTKEISRVTAQSAFKELQERVYTDIDRVTSFEVAKAARDLSDHQRGQMSDVARQMFLEREAVILKAATDAASLAVARQGINHWVKYKNFSLWTMFISGVLTLLAVGGAVFLWAGNEGKAVAINVINDKKKEIEEQYKGSIESATQQMLSNDIKIQTAKDDIEKLREELKEFVNQANKIGPSGLSNIVAAIEQFRELKPLLTILQDTKNKVNTLQQNNSKLDLEVRKIWRDIARLDAIIKKRSPGSSPAQAGPNSQSSPSRLPEPQGN